MRERKNKNGEKTVACVVCYMKPFVERPKKEAPVKKGKSNPKRKNHTSCQSHSVTPADTVLT